jgi:hypothetical protein
LTLHPKSSDKKSETNQENVSIVMCFKEKRNEKELEEKKEVEENKSSV